MEKSAKLSATHDVSGSCMTVRCDFERHEQSEHEEYEVICSVCVSLVSVCVCVCVCTE